MAGHDPISFANDLSAKLASRSRHVCAFLGAGTSKACGLPDVTALQTSVLATLAPPFRELFEKQLAGRTLEQALSRVRRIAAVLDGSAELDGLTRTSALELDGHVCQAVVAALSLEAADLDAVLRLASWAARADYRWPLELFTVNYDLLLETALERMRVTYFDGFVGSLEGRFHIDLVEGAPEEARDWLPRSFVRLWKLHGSVNWAWSDDGTKEIVRLGAAVTEGGAAAIYPSDAKYDESRRVPFVVLQDRLRRALAQPETLMIISGYSFADDHLNELIYDAATRRQRSEIVAFCYSEIPEVLKERASRTPNLQAITGHEAVIGGVLNTWDAPKAGAVAPADIWSDGVMAMRDFKSLAGYLARSSSPQHEVEKRLGELLAKAIDG